MHIFSEYLRPPLNLLQTALILGDMTLRLFDTLRWQFTCLGHRGGSFADKIHVRDALYVY